MIRQIISLSFCFLALISFGQNRNVYKEKNGSLVIELESLKLNSSWTSDVDGKTGFIYWKGQDYFGSPGEGALKANISISNPGKYIFRWRNKIGEGERTTDFNDSWFKIPDADDFYAANDTVTYYAHGSGQSPTPKGSGGQGFFKVYCSNSLDWTWASYTSDHEDCSIYAVFEEKGEYTIEIAPRSRLHCIDKLVLVREDVSIEGVIEKLNLNKNLSCKKDYSFSAIDDFKIITSDSLKPGYIDKGRNALAIDAGIYKGEYAGAELIFKGKSGNYKFELTTMTEIDGESTYQVVVNKKIIGTCQNPDNGTDFEKSMTKFDNIFVNQGDTIQVRFNSHTNGKVPEPPTTAYSRGRWTSLKLVCDK